MLDSRVRELPGRNQLYLCSRFVRKLYDDLQIEANDQLLTASEVAKLSVIAFNLCHARSLSGEALATGDRGEIVPTRRRPTSSAHPKY